MLKTAITPFLRWAGSKRKLLPHLIRYWGAGHVRYVEPFMGSAALFYAIRPPSALLSDTNVDLVETFEQVRDHPLAVYRRMMGLPRGREAYYSVRALDPTRLDPLERAARFIYLNRFCFNGLYRTNTKGAFNVPFGASRTGQPPVWEQFRQASRALTQVEFVHGDFETVLRLHVCEGDFVYLDPPYAVANRRIFRQYGPQTFGLDDLQRLRHVLEMIEDRGASFVLSYADCTEAARHFAGWPVEQVYAQRNISGFARHRRKDAEMIVSNLDVQALAHVG